MVEDGASRSCEVGRYYKYRRIIRLVCSASNFALVPEQRSSPYIPTAGDKIGS